MQYTSFLSLLVLPASLGAAAYTAGHGDIGLAEGPGLGLHWHLHGGATVGGSILEADGEFEPSDLTAVVPLSTFQRSQATGGRPVGAQWDFLGVPAGTPYWFLPSGNTGASGASTLGAPFLGIGSEDATFTEDITFALTAKTGPGHFSLFQAGVPDVFFATSDGIGVADSFIFPAGSHDHFVYAFTQPGLYELTFTVTGLIGGLPQTDSATFAFQVVPEPSTYALMAGIGILGLAVWKRRRA